MTKELRRLRRDVDARLPGLIERAVAGYRGIAETDPPLDAKNFAAHQTACRAALNHLEGLLKLARWLVVDGQASGAVGEDLAGLVDEARRALSSMDEGN